LEKGMTKILRASAFAICAAVMSAPLLAGEITGPPPTTNQPSPQGTRISNGVSICSFSGLNDTPQGIPGVDPGGIAQSYGYFMAQFGIFDPSDPDKFTSGTFPGQNCNPNRGPRLPH
jgi:hypothetical protein